MIRAVEKLQFFSFTTARSSVLCPKLIRATELWFPIREDGHMPSLVRRRLSFKQPALSDRLRMEQAVPSWHMPRAITAGAAVAGGRRSQNSTAVADGDSKLEPVLEVSKLSSLPAAASLGDPVLGFLKLFKLRLGVRPRRNKRPLRQDGPFRPPSTPSCFDS